MMTGWRRFIHFSHSLWTCIANWLRNQALFLLIIEYLWFYKLGKTVPLLRDALGALPMFFFVAITSVFGAFCCDH